MKIVGLTGFAKSGKSTVAGFLKELGGQEVAFAKHLKDVCSVALDIPRDYFDNQEFKEKPFFVTLNEYDIGLILRYFQVSCVFEPEAIIKHAGVILESPRQIAQYVGTEILRAIDPNIHINMAFKLNENSKAKFLICSDIRFENELKAVKGRGGVVMGIQRDSIKPADMRNLHASEAEIPKLIFDADTIIFNQSTTEELKTAVEFSVHNYLKD